MRPRRVASSRNARLRVRWDRAGRVGLLVVIGIVGILYLQHALSLFTIHSQAQQQLANVQRLVQENAKLTREAKALGDPATIQRDARALGMVRPGERPYVITGVPSH